MTTKKKGPNGPASSLNPLNVKLNMDERIAIDLIDCMQRPPYPLTPEYTDVVKRTADLLIGSPLRSENIYNDTGSRNSWQDSSFPEQGNDGAISKNITAPILTGGSSDQEKIRNHVNALRNGVFDTINRINAFVARAKNAGFVPPENPFVLAMSYNVNRVGFFPLPKLPEAVVSRIVKNIIAYLSLLNAETDGRINLGSNINSSAQLSSVKFSLDGFGGSGDALVDLSRILPDSDEIKAQKAAESLSVFDFSKRVPKLLFTAHYAPDGIPKGIIVGWKKIPDASGYVIKRRNVFDGNEATYSATNADVKSSNARLLEYVKAWILSFYDNVTPESVCCFLDADVSPNAYFMYSIQSYQLQSSNPGTLFNVEATPYFISQALKAQIRSQLELLDPNRDALAKNATANLRGLPPAQPGNPDLISPWPVLAHFILGDSKYDWMLAALNIRQSINRSDTRTTTRSYSYLAAQLSFLFAQADAGKLMVPKNIGAVASNIENAISQFGTGQVIKDVLQETGALYHFEGKDPNDNSLFSNIDSSDSSQSGLIATVAASIDPENATLNLRTLATNIPKLLSGEFVSTQDSLADSVKKHASKTASPKEIEITNFDRPDNNRASDEIQYLNELGDIGDGIIDLTTTDGIAKFIRTIRIFSDLGPNRGAPLVNEPVSFYPDPVQGPAPAPAPRSTTQPVAPLPPPARSNSAPAPRPPAKKLADSAPKGGTGTGGTGGTGRGGRDPDDLI